MVENMLKYIDKKTERRWWLRDVINFTQAAVKVALFISAAISVAYHENQIAPIITLVITVIQVGQSEKKIKKQKISKKSY